MFRITILASNDLPKFIVNQFSLFSDFIAPSLLNLNCTTALKDLQNLLVRFSYETLQVTSLQPDKCGVKN